MYIPASFQVDDRLKQVEFIRRHSFATLVTHDREAPFASHLPVLYEAGKGRGTLVAHMARGNPQWRHFGEAEVLTVFQGPHAYISPTWYEAAPAVQTWNYAAVHVYGVPRIITDHDRIGALLKTTTDTFESALDNLWDGDLPADFRDSLIEAIVGFEIPIRRIEAKFKLGQNRSTGDQLQVYEQLMRGAQQSRELATLMERECDLRPAADV